MYKERISRPAIFSLVILVATLACNFPGQEVDDADERATSLAQTAAALLTETSLAPESVSTPAIAATSPPDTSTPAPAPTTSPTAADTNTPVAGPTFTATLVPSSTICDLDSDFVGDITVPDGTKFDANTAFTKTWLLRNSGNCTWDGGYRFVHIGDELMGAQPSIPLPGVVQPGEEINISVNFVSPDSAGTYRSRWQLEGPGANKFGTRPFVEIVVK